MTFPFSVGIEDKLYTQALPELPKGHFNTRVYGDKIMVTTCGLDTRITGGNFQNLLLYNPEGGFGASPAGKVHKIPRNAIDWMKEIQADNTGYSLTEQMNWFFGRLNTATGSNPGRPYWTIYPQRWNDTGWSHAYFGSFFFAGNVIKIKLNSQNNPVITKFYAKYPAMNYKQDIYFYEMADESYFYKSDIGKATPQSHPDKFQFATSAEVRRDANGKIIAHNIYEPRPRGLLWHPNWHPVDFPLNYGTKLYVSIAFLKSMI